MTGPGRCCGHTWRVRAHSAQAALFYSLDCDLGSNQRALGTRLHTWHDQRPPEPPACPTPVCARPRSSLGCRGEPVRHSSLASQGCTQSRHSGGRRHMGGNQKSWHRRHNTSRRGSCCCEPASHPRRAAWSDGRDSAMGLRMPSCAACAGSPRTLLSRESHRRRVLPG